MQYRLRGTAWLISPSGLQGNLNRLIEKTESAGYGAPSIRGRARWRWRLPVPDDLFWDSKPCYSPGVSDTIGFALTARSAA